MDLQTAQAFLAVKRGRGRPPLGYTEKKLKAIEVINRAFVNWNLAVLSANPVAETVEVAEPVALTPPGPVVHVVTPEVTAILDTLPTPTVAW